MLRMTRSARARVAIVITASVAFVGTTTLATTTLAHANPQSDLTSQRQKAAELEAQIEANGNRVSVLDEQYTKAQLAIEQATAKINADEAQLRTKTRETSDVRDRLAARGAELYMGAGNPAPLAALDLTNAGDLGSRSAYGGAAADQDRQLLNEVKVAVEQLGLQQASLEKARAAAVKQRDALDRARQEITRATEQQQSLLGQVNGQIKTLVNEIQVQKAQEEAAAARATSERLARQQALAAQQSQTGSGSDTNSGSSSGSSASGSSSSGPPTVSAPNLPAPSSQAQVAIDTARAQLGKPYEIGRAHV
jgi:septal ring factor EnvC (AmiA/AmiB activator)